MKRTILHCDCNSFFASVETVFRPELKNVPMAVAGSSDMRHGIILAKNELAKKYNIKTAETVWQARRKCPDLVLVPPHHKEYSVFSKKVNEIYLRYTDLVEPFGIDESWLDVSSCINTFGSGFDIAEKLRETVKNELGLTISVGVSFNKVFAKLGSDYKKPDAVTVIDEENYRDIVYPLPASDLLFVGRRTANTLEKMGIRTIGELAGIEEEKLVNIFGKQGRMLSLYSKGEDDSPVLPYDSDSDIKSVGNGMTFKHDITNEDELRIGVIALSDMIAGRMRKYGVKCSTLQVTLKDPDFHSVQRQMILDEPTYLSKDIVKATSAIISKELVSGSPVRAMTITGVNLVDADEGEQMSLFVEEDAVETRAKIEKLERSVDDIRKRFGSGSVIFGSSIDNNIGVDD